MHPGIAKADRAVLVLSESYETLLTLGGDDRIDVGEATGFNRYGCTPRHRDVVAFGSCTSSSSSRVGVAGARAALYRLRGAARAGGERAVDAEAQTLLQETRERLVRELELDADAVEVAFCPSGTDAEYLALALVRAGSEQPVVSIVAGPSEVGSGTTLAAGGRHFLPSVPCGATREPGDSVDAELSDDVRVRTIILRDDEGRMHPAGSLDDEAERMVEDAVAAGSKVLLHVVAHSKTGVHAPRLARIRALRERYPDQVHVLVDAAQGRVSRRGLREALAEGFLVLFTGSKFYGGPAFSGGLFVPQNLWPSETGLTSLPEGLSDYFTQGELPQTWTALRSSLPAAPNLGLVLRWGAAIAEISAYYRIEPECRLEILRAWETAVPELLDGSDVIRLVPVLMAQQPQSKPQRLLESKTTVFPFFLRRPSGKLIGRANLKRIFNWLNRDISGLLMELSGEQKAVLSRSIHVGQPVLLSGNADSERAVLRVALGSALVTRVASDTRLAPTYVARLHWLGAQIEILRMKIELIVKHLDELLDREAQEPT